jgi:hypothetical protein
MTKYPNPKEARSPNDENESVRQRHLNPQEKKAFLMFGTTFACRRSLRFSGFVIRNSFVPGYFVIRHSG